MGSIVLFLESAKEGRKGLVSSLAWIASGLGVLLGAMVAEIMYDTTGDATIKAWAWRLPFLGSAVFSPVALYFQWHMDDSPEFEYVKAQSQLIDNPLRYGVRKYYKEMLYVSLTIAQMGCAYWLFRTSLPVSLRLFVCF